MDTYDHLRADATRCGGDPAACLILADWLAERGRHDEAEFWRLLGDVPYVVRGDTIDPENHYASVVTVDWDAFLVNLEPHLPRPILERISDTERILDDLWVSREAACRDLLAAWLKAKGV